MRRYALFLVALALPVFLGGCGDSSSPKLTIAAASSLRELLEATKPSFEKKHLGLSLAFSYDSSAALARQIDSAAGFDAFLSADAASIERILHRLDAATVAPFLSNRMALVARADLAAPASEPAALRASAGPIAIAGEAVPAGKYGRAMLQRLGLLADLQPRFVEADNVRATLALVESGAADHGIVYVTDARIAKKAKVVWSAAIEDDPGIVYVAASTRGAPALAAEYVEWLRDDLFQREAAALGFLPPPGS